MEHVDVLIVGAGISGVSAAHHLQERCPGRSYAILEARDAIGGTWDLFRYPGIRSDSDMFTLGYRFRPWKAAKAIADGPAILEYVRETAAEAGIDRRVRFGHRVVRASWSSEDARWTVEAERSGTGETVRLTCGFLFTCTGYYRYDQGYLPGFPGVERFAGRLVHPQHWPADLDHRGTRVVVIGSGATAVTIVPAIAGEAEHVTMLQRSPSYVISLPERDPIADAVRRVLPPRLAHPVMRWKNVLLTLGFYKLSRRSPELVRRLLRRGVRRHLPEGFDVDTHFNPRYDPWDQRLCVVPDGDLFEAVSAGTASIVTDTIETFTERGIRLTSGAELEADVVVSATGLNLLVLGGLELTVDGEPVRFPERVAYKGLMLSGVPNLAFAVGYTNASWTLRCDLVSQYVCRLLRHMDAHGYVSATPRRPPGAGPAEPFLDLASGYVLRSIDAFPKQGDRMPWKVRQDYTRDLRVLRHGPLDDDMAFARAPAAAPSRPAPPAAALPA
jgi:cation diffusion facilitator CzcD-associated flavoprotein CzcO